MNLKDATLVLASESAAYPELARLAQSAYDDLVDGREVHYGVLDDIVGKASEKGVLRVLRRKYSATAFEAIIMPILREVGRQKPIPPRRRPPSRQQGDPLTAPLPTGT
ncbi:MAG: hypothetical protein LBV34_25885 [Nocardiopsaceae bacterium]|jgi:hypothetical protein|nr:hypothetical protein [Nocardiopsaceae bacterium]